MMKKIIFFIALVTFFSGCAVSGDEFIVSPSSNNIEISATNSPTRISDQNLVITITSTPELPTVIAHETTEPTLNTLRLCSSQPRIFNFRDELDINFVTNLRFVDESLLTFNGWATEQSVLPTVTSEGSTSSDPFELGSFKITSEVGYLDLTNGNLYTETSVPQPLLNTPCSGNCAVDVWSQSPNEQWQLIQVYTGLPEEIGVWLVNQNELIQLVSYIPPESSWQWAVDSSLLWYLYYDREYGAYADAIHLRSPLSANFYNKGDDDPMNPTNHSLAFSPQSKTLLSTYVTGKMIENELKMLDLMSVPPAVTSIETITGLNSVSWNEATSSYILQIIREDGVEFRNTSGVSALIPQTLLQVMYPSLAKGAVEVGEIIPKENYAISPTAEYLAIAYPHGEIEVYLCNSNSTK